MALPQEIDVLVSKDQIRSVLIQYCRAADRRDLESLKDVYWPDAMDDHGMFRGNAHEFCEMNVRTASQVCLVTQHMITNMDCRIEGDRAHVESYVLAYHTVAGTEQAMTMLMGEAYAKAHAGGDGTHICLAGGQYFDQFERRNGVWKIINRIAKRDWGIGQPSSLDKADSLAEAAKEFGVDLSSAKNPGPRPVVS